MGEISLWDRVRWWLCHPIDRFQEAMAVRYVCRHDLEMGPISPT